MMTISQEELKAARTRLKLTTKKAAELLGVTQHRFQRWEGQTASDKTIPSAYWELFQLLTDTHPTKKLVDKNQNIVYQQTDYANGITVVNDGKNIIVSGLKGGGGSGLA